MIPTLEWTDEGVRFLDQTKLPLEEVYVNTTTYGEVATVIRDMIVRGAPAIGVSGAMGMALGIDRSSADNIAELSLEVNVMADVLSKDPPHSRQSLLGHRANPLPVQAPRRRTTCG